MNIDVLRRVLFVMRRTKVICVTSVSVRRKSGDANHPFSTSEYEPLVNISCTLAPRVAGDRDFPEGLHVVLFRDKLQIGTNQDLRILRFRAIEEREELRHIFMVYIVLRLIWMISWLLWNLRTSSFSRRRV